MSSFIISIYAYIFTIVCIMGSQRLGVNISCKWWSSKDLKYTSKLVMKWLKENKDKVLEWPSQSPGLNQFVCSENTCIQEGLKNGSIYTSSVKRNWPKFQQIIVRSLWKETQNLWPKWYTASVSFYQILRKCMLFLGWWKSYKTICIKFFLSSFWHLTNTKNIWYRIVYSNLTVWK